MLKPLNSREVALSDKWFSTRFHFTGNGVYRPLLLRRAHHAVREIADRDVDPCILDSLEIEIRMLLVAHFQMLPIDPFHLQIDKACLSVLILRERQN
jgi:hypothetical protein